MASIASDAAMKAREDLLVELRNQSGDAEVDHLYAEKLLIKWLEIFDTELAGEWEKASEDWWYA